MSITVVSRGSELPLPGVEVRVHVATEEGLRREGTGRRRRRFAVASARTDEDGRARFLLARGVYVVTVGSSDTATSHRVVVHQRTHVVVEADRTLHRHPLTVTVTRRGRGVGGVPVRVKGGWEATTGPDGTCVLLLPTGLHEVRVGDEVTTVSHRAAGTVVFALPEATGLDDGDWEPAPPEWSDDPFTIAEEVRPAVRRRPAAAPPVEAPAPPPLPSVPQAFRDRPSADTARFTASLVWGDDKDDSHNG